MKFSEKLWKLFGKDIDSYLDSGWTKASVSYNARGSGYIDIRKVFNVTAEGEAYLNKLIAARGWRSLGNDDKMTAIADFVNSKLRYVTDASNYGKTEFWADPYTVLTKGRDDCDGFAVLIFYLAINSGVPRNRIRLVAGNFQGDGHAYIIYRKEQDSNFYTIEGPCYADEARKRFLKNVSHGSAHRYGEIWWYTTDLESYSKVGNLIIKRGMGI